MALLVPDPGAALRRLAEHPVVPDLEAALRYQQAELARARVCLHQAGHWHLLAGD
jgi:hypothetical protein